MRSGAAGVEQRLARCGGIERLNRIYSVEMQRKVSPERIRAIFLCHKEQKGLYEQSSFQFLRILYVTNKKAPQKRGRVVTIMNQANFSIVPSAYTMRIT